MAAPLSEDLVTLLRKPLLVHVATVMPYRMFEIRGTVDLVEDGADDHIDFLAKKYLNEDKYPFRQPGEERVIVQVRPEAIAET